MSTRSWFKSHRKQVITHTLIVAAFLLFLFFLAEPIFDRFEPVAGESRLYDTALPAATNNIEFSIDQPQVMTEVVVIRGWAFIEGHDSVESEIYIVLKSTDRTYIFTTKTEIRNDVTRRFEELNLILDYSGFTALISAKTIADGEYTIGIYIKKGNIESLQYTSRAITKSRGTIVTG